MALNHHVGYSRANECWFVRFYPYQTEQQAKDAVSDFTRPAAPVEGLDTVGYVTTSPTGAEVFQRKPLVPGHGQFGYKQDAVVTRSQAEELLAAERAETMRQVKHWSELYKQQHYRAEKAEAIIAALTARVNSAEGKVKTLSSLCEEGFNREKALETKLAAARKALEWYEEHVSNCRKIGSVGAPSRAKLDRDGGAIARAALECKP